MDKHYDTSGNRLVYLGAKAEPEFWDGVWMGHRPAADFGKGRFPFLERTTLRHLPVGSRILEGGCGEGEKLFALHQLGYAVCGVDYATRTVERLRRLAPELNVIEGDLHRLPFDDADFDGYWSLGVIEHYVDGFDGLLREMRRVLRPGGVSFVTAPSMNLLRHVKARLGMYPRIGDPCAERDRFYQFAVNPQAVIARFEVAGFRLLECRRLDSVTGLQDELPALKSLLHRVDNSRWLPARVLMKSIRTTLAPLTGHVTLYVFRRGPDRAAD